MSSVFDVETFLDATTTEALQRRPPLPAGMDFVATLGEPKGRQGEKDGKAWRAIDFPVEIDLAAYPDVQKAMGGLAKVTLKYGFIIDVNDGGMIDWSVGKNNGLRRLREATNMNVAGQAFNMRAMQGRMIKVKINHREFQGDMLDEVASVAKV
jgi:hypothetical protein